MFLNISFWLYDYIDAIIFLQMSRPVVLYLSGFWDIISITLCTNIFYEIKIYYFSFNYYFIITIIKATPWPFH